MDSNPESKTIGERIRQLRSDRKWSQYDLADKSGVTRPVINLIESNKVKRIDHYNVVKIAAAFDVDPRYLAGDQVKATDKEELLGELEILRRQTDDKLRDIIKRLRNM